jgi:homoserine kinase
MTQKRLNQQVQPGTQHPFAAGNKSLTVTVPGSCANLGPGFDTLAVAVDLSCTISLKLAAGADLQLPAVTLAGPYAKQLSSSDDNLVLKTLTQFWPLSADLLPRLRLSIDSQIPPGRGLGSSAAAVVASLYAVNALSMSHIDHSQLLAAAQQIEGHADNAAASLLGGLVLCCPSQDKRSVVARKLVWPQQWQLIVTVPNYELSTKKARSVLPENVSRSDAVANLQRLSLLLAAASDGDDAALTQALSDRLHEPYRQDLVPELRQVRQVLSDTPALGTVLSGAGCSVLTIVNRRHHKQVLGCLSSWAKQQKQPPAILPVDVARQGAVCVFQ